MTAIAPEVALLSAVVAAAPVGAALAGPDFTLLEVNPALCVLLGYTPEELLGTSLWSLLDPGGPHPDGPVKTPGEQREQFEEEHLFRHRDGRGILARMTVSRMPTQQACPATMLVYVHDCGKARIAPEDALDPQISAQEVLGRVTDGFLALDRNWRLTYVNEAASRMVGLAPGDLLGVNIWEAFPAAARSPVFEAYHTAVRDGVPVSIEHFFPTSQGWFEIRAYPSADGLSVIFGNITEAKQLENTLRISDAKHRFLLDHVPAVIYALANNAEQTRLYFSPRHMELTGYTLAETLAQQGHWLDLVHPDDRPRAAAENDRAEAAGDRFRAEYRLRRKDGTYVWVLDECIPVRDEDGQITTWQGVLLDITDRITAQAAQNHLAALVMSAEDAVISSDLDGLMTSWNPGATQLYGYRAEEMVGQPYVRLLPGDVDREALEARIRSARAGGTVEVFETQRQRKDGTIVDVAITMSSIRDENGKVIGVSTIARDITERKQGEQALRDALEAAEAAARTKSLFLAMMSHELRTPVQAVLGYADLLLLDPEIALTPEQLADVTFIRDGARRLDRLIDQLLDLSRLEGGRLVLDVKAVALDAIVEEVRQDIAPQAKAKHLALEIDVPASLPLALGDPDRLRQIVLNLAENAVKFTDEGTVRIRAREVESGLALDVSDTGIGIASEALPTIFEEFRQVDSNLSRRYGGAGLGLAIAERLAVQMNGSLTVSSTVGQGSTFVLSLPRA